MLRLLLDYDGTLHHCLKIYAPAFRLAYRSLVDRGYRPERTWQAGELVRWLGLTPSAMWEAFAPDLPRAVREGCAKQIEGEMLRLTAAGEARLYPGVPEALEKLRGMGYSLILLSNCQRTASGPIWRPMRRPSSWGGTLTASTAPRTTAGPPKGRCFPSSGGTFPGTTRRWGTGPPTGSWPGGTGCPLWAAGTATALPRSWRGPSSSSPARRSCRMPRQG